MQHDHFQSTARNRGRNYGAGRFRGRRAGNFGSRLADEDGEAICSQTQSNVKRPPIKNGFEAVLNLWCMVPYVVSFMKAFSLNKSVLGIYGRDE